MKAPLRTEKSRRYELLEMLLVLLVIPAALLTIHLLPKDSTDLSSSRRVYILAYFFLAGYFSVYCVWMRFSLFNSWIADVARSLNRDMRVEAVRGGQNLNVWLSGWSVILLLAVLSGGSYVYHLWAWPATASAANGTLTLDLYRFVQRARLCGYAAIITVCGTLLYPFVFRQWWFALADLRAVLFNLRMGRIGHTSHLSILEVFRELLSPRSESLAILSNADDAAFSVAGLEWKWGDLAKNVAIFGQTGTGKTSCVMNAMLEGAVGAQSVRGGRFGGLVLDPKGEFRETLEWLCRRYGIDAPMVLDFKHPENSLRWNPLLEANRSATEVAADVMLVSEMLQSGQGGNQAFWTGQSLQWLSNAIAMLRTIEPSGVSFKRLFSMVNDVQAQGEVFQRFIREYNPVSEPQKTAKHELAQAWSAHLRLTEDAPQQFAGICGNIQNVLHPFTDAPADELFCTRSDFSIADLLDKGRIIYAYVPIDEQAQLSRSVLALLKLQYFRCVRARGTNPPSASFFFCDEYQQVASFHDNGSDSAFFATCRAYRHANIIATQNLSGLLAQAPPGRQEMVHQLLANCGTKVFLRNGDRATNEYGQSQFPEQMMVSHQYGQQANPGWRMRNNANYNEIGASHPSVPMDAFLSLATPVKGGNPHAESYVAHPLSCMARIYRWPRHVAEVAEVDAANPPPPHAPSSPRPPQTRDPLHDFY